MNQPVTERHAMRGVENDQNDSSLLNIAAKESGKSPEKGEDSVFLRRIPGMSRGVFISDAMTCESLYRKYLLYFRAQQRIRKSKPLIDDNNNSSAPPRPDYLKYLHCLPPPKLVTDFAAKNDTHNTERPQRHAQRSL